MEMPAAKLGLDPFKFRLRNILKPGQTKSTGRGVTEWPLPELTEVMRPHHERARCKMAAASTATLRRGVGLATSSFGIGGPDDASEAAVELDADSAVNVYAAAADPGESNDSMLTQITAEFMGLSLDKIRTNTRSTDLTAASGSAVGSRITYMIGGAGFGDPCQARCLGNKKNEDAGPLDPETGQQGRPSSPRCTPCR